MYGRLWREEKIIIVPTRKRALKNIFYLLFCKEGNITCCTRNVDRNLDRRTVQLVSQTPHIRNDSFHGVDQHYFHWLLELEFLFWSHFKKHFEKMLVSMSLKSVTMEELRISKNTKAFEQRPNSESIILEVGFPILSKGTTLVLVHAYYFFFLQNKDSSFFSFLFFLNFFRSVIF